MYQFSIPVQEYNDGFTQTVDKLKQRLSSLPVDRLLFHIYSTVFATQTLTDLISRLNEQFPGCRLVFCSVSGGVLDYDYQPGIVISVQVLERQDSRVEVRSFALTDCSDKEAADEITRFVREHSWVKAVEIYRTVHDMNTSDFCETLSELPEDIVVFGGLASAERIPGNLSYVADQSGRLLDQGIVAVYYGGNDLHIKAYRMSGWKAIDKSFTVTKAENNIIREIDGAPAHEIYKRYLDIQPDEGFVRNVLEFPLLSRDGGHSVVRNVFALAPDGGLVVAYDVNVGTRLKITYADAESVVEDINAVSRELMRFTPDVISTVSCITRSMIWQMQEYMPELAGFRPVAPCHGYLSHGELIREDGVLNHHNTILVAAAFREGGLKDVSYPEAGLSIGSTIPLAVRLSTFISRVTAELKDMYSEVEHAATTDALTRIGNRYMFDAVIKTASADAAHADTKYLMMFDMNALKFINDTFGHNEGDALIKTAADTISSTFSQFGQCFRIGGDEFAVIADFKGNAVLQKALDDFHPNVHEYNTTSPYPLSIAVGYAALINEEGKLLSSSEWVSTADINMYRDKSKFHAITPSVLSHDMSDFFTCIMTLVDNKNSVTALHSVRVQRMAVAIAKLMQLGDAVIDRINLGAYLHDIGKIGISDLVLTKTDALTEDERQLLMQKPIISRRILMTSEETNRVAHIIYTSYECWDGSGYPEGLAGNAIPLEARVIAVADYIDTELHDGYGKAAISTEECMEELRRYSGSMFDPAVVSVVLENFEDIIEDDPAV